MSCSPCQRRAQPGANSGRSACEIIRRPLSPAAATIHGDAPYVVTTPTRSMFVRSGCSPVSVGLESPGRACFGSRNATCGRNVRSSQPLRGPGTFIHQVGYTKTRACAQRRSATASATSGQSLESDCVSETMSAAMSWYLARSVAVNAGGKSRPLNADPAVPVEMILSSEYRVLNRTSWPAARKPVAAARAHAALKLVEHGWHWTNKTRFDSFTGGIVCQ
mmetsp:Transcript_29012/g.58323  ORF Transcript_29012/g.58323 Transcript_29012/m.58323 type:complete len:220 (-) Transcript_29012:133-792(-)